VSVKWSGVFALLAAWALTAHTLQRRRPDWRGTLVAAAALTLVPAGVYLASYTGWFLNVEDSHAGRERCEQGECPQGLAETTVVWWEEQLELIDYHRRLPTTHPYRSPAWSWPLLQRPVLYYLERCPPPGEEACRVAVGREAKILGLGNPVLWWAALAAFPVLAWQAARRRRGGELALVTFLAFQFLPWLAVGKEGYLFYLLPLVPFLGLAVTRVVGNLGRLRRWVLPSLVVAAVAAFAYFSPILYGVESHPDVLDSRIWFDSWE
jgi:dolichyl-phosphate-mannose--protein O-mannosyl transferase